MLKFSIYFLFKHAIFQSMDPVQMTTKHLSQNTLTPLAQIISKKDVSKNILQKNFRFSKHIF